MDVLSFFGRSGYLPHGYCFNWTPGLLWTMVASDTVIALAYFSIPAAIGCFIYKRRERSLYLVAALFCAFIFACGLTHLLDVWTIWRPDYGLQAIGKLGTALISTATAVLLWRLLPAALAIPSTQELQRAIRSLEDEVRKRRVAEDGLVSTQQSLAVTLASIDAGFLATDRQGRITCLNNVAERVLGWTEEQARGQPLMRVFVREGMAPDVNATNPVDAVMEAGLSIETSRRDIAVGRDGRRTPIEAKTALTHQEDGSVLGLAVVFRDRSQIVQAELATYHAENYFRQVVESVPNGLLMVDRNQKITLVNRPTENMFGYTRAEMLGQPLGLLVPERSRGVHGGLVDGYLAQPAFRAMGAGRELFGRHKNGSEVPIEIGLNPIDTPNGLFTLAAIIDISERKQADMANRRLVSIVESSADAIVSKTIDGTITSWNHGAQELFGYTPQEAIGQSIFMLVPERLMEEEVRVMNLIRRHERLNHFETRRRRKDGSEVDVSVRLSPIFNAAGEVVGESNIARDISDLKRRDAELQRSNAELEQFAYVASHDLRGPLKGIDDLVEWIVADLGEAPPAAVQKNLDRIRLRIQRMDGLIEDLLTYARAGRLENELTRVSLDALVRGIIELQPTPLGFEVVLDLGDEEFMAARVPLEAALRNLLSNAIKHHDRKQGCIQVSARVVGDFCEIHVVDDGPGIPADAQERVFKLFQTGGRQSGSGIGLALTKRVVETHGGHIELTSPVMAGRGTAFHILWPRTAPQLG
ncbi:MAG: PAS domain S-box protein [Burkholderiales bacterium]|nr:PAS domain S-box protein [Burkholderiales bacterium]